MAMSIWHRLSFVAIFKHPKPRFPFGAIFICFFSSFNNCSLIYLESSWLNVELKRKHKISVYNTDDKIKRKDHER